MKLYTMWKLMQNVEVSAIKEMEAQTGIQLDFSITDDPELYPLLTDPDRVSTVGIPGLRTPTAREYLRRIMPEDFSQLVRVIAFYSGTFCRKEDNQKFVIVSGQTLFCMCDEVMAYALRYGIPVEEASQIM